MSYRKPPSHTPRNDPTWWLRNTKPLSIDRWATPKMPATMALVAGTVDSHRKPMAAEKTYTLSGEIGTSKKRAIDTARAK
ncbi:hypothetical protein D9M72_175560 [compost metagenome]